MGNLSGLVDKTSVLEFSKGLYKAKLLYSKLVNQKATPKLWEKPKSKLIFFIPDGISIYQIVAVPAAEI